MHNPAEQLVLTQKAWNAGQQWWYDTTTGVRGVSPHHEAVVDFTVRKLLDMVSPANFGTTNPELLERMLRDYLLGERSSVALTAITCPI